MEIKSQNWVKKHGSAKSPLQKSILVLAFKIYKKENINVF